jgi:sorbitol-specific phosphotransferase system component IIA
MTPVWEEEETKPNETESDKTDETGKTDETDKKDETNGGQNTVTTPIGSTTNPTTPTQEAVKEGESRVVNGYTYKVTSLSGKTVEVTGTTKTGTAIKVPATVKIGETTFKVTSVGKNAFKNNKKATSVTIGKNVETIGSSAFAGCVKVKKVTIQSKKLKEIGSKAFSNNKALKKLTLKTTVLKKVGSKAFKGINKKAVIKVPASKVKAYKKLLAKKGQSKTVSIK